MPPSAAPIPPPLPADYHLHTPLCQHAEGAPAAYRATAQRLGLAEICFSDHAPAPCGYDAACRMRLEQFDRDLEKEPQRISEFYEVQARRVEPVGLVYLWPESN